MLNFTVKNIYNQKRDPTGDNSINIFNSPFESTWRRYIHRIKIGYCEKEAIRE